MAGIEPCNRCEYDLTGISADVCPECGASKSIRRSVWRDGGVRPWLIVAGSLLASAPLLLAYPLVLAAGRLSKHMGSDEWQIVQLAIKGACIGVSVIGSLWMMRLAVLGTTHPINQLQRRLIPCASMGSAVLVVIVQTQN